MRYPNVKQIRDLVIIKDTVESVNYWGLEHKNSQYGKYKVYMQNGVLLKENLTFKDAEQYCKSFYQDLREE